MVPRKLRELQGLDHQLTIRSRSFRSASRAARPPRLASQCRRERGYKIFGRDLTHFGNIQHIFKQGATRGRFVQRLGTIGVVTTRGMTFARLGDAMDCSRLELYF